MGGAYFFFLNKYTKESCNAASIGSNPGPQLRLCNWPCDGRTFHLAFIVYCDPCIIFKIKKRTIFSPVWLSMSNYHRWMYLLSELCFAFLGWGRQRVTLTGSRESIQSSSEPLHRDDRQVFELLCFQNSWSGLQVEDPRKSGISHQRTHHVLASTSWTLERDKKEKNPLLLFNLHLLQP